MRFLLAFAFACLGTAAFAQALDPNAVIATVDGDKVLATEYYTRMAYLDGVGTMNSGRFIEVPPAYLTIQRLLNERFVLQVAKDKGVLPTAAEVAAELAKRKADSPERYQRLKDLGVNESSLMSEVAVDLSQYKLVTQGIVITDEQINNHYNLNKMVYRKPATVKLRVIVVENAADRAKVDEALKAKSFIDVAKTMSTDITKFDGGDLPMVAIVNLPQNVLNEVMRTAAGKPTSWIESSGAFLKYLVESKTEDQQMPLDDKLRSEIRRRMMLVAGQQKNGDAIQTLLAGKRKAAKVVISSPGLQKLWNLYVAGR